MKNIEDQVTREKILNKTLTSGTNKIDERNNDGLMIDALNDKTIDEFYIEYPVGSNCFTLRREDGRLEINTKSKKYFHELKNWPK